MTEVQETVGLAGAPAPRRSGAFLYLLGTLAVGATVVLAGVVVMGRRAAVAAEASNRQHVAAAGVSVLVVAAARLPAGRNVTLPGEVKPWRQATLYGKVSGYVQRMFVDKGDTVKQGQLLATLESPETDQQVQSARADLATKKLIADRYTHLAPQGVVAQQELDQASGNLAVANAELARVAALGAYESIRAPFDGIVTARFVDPGALIPAATGSTTSAQPVFEVTDMSRVRITVYLGQSDAPFVHEGTPVKLESDAHPGDVVDATVTRITRELDARTRTMLTEIDIDNGRGWAYPGLFVRVSMKVDSPSEVGIPADAVFLKDGRPMVAVVEGGRAHFRSIEAGDDDGRIVRVLSGLHEGDLVALHAGDEVTDGAPVRAVPAPTGK
ncbi:MAG TPA: efflux RND transporter periplasmic adaptor subunit [Polyangiaceae bacterium]|jgi:RND family efflux transporter MFP subunit